MVRKNGFLFCYEKKAEYSGL